MKATPLFLTFFVDIALCLPPKGFCPNGWILDSTNRKCYFYHEKPSNFINAFEETSNESLTGQLVHLQTDADVVSLLNLLDMKTAYIWYPHRLENRNNEIYAIDRHSNVVSDCRICINMNNSFTGENGTVLCIGINVADDVVQWTLLNCTNFLSFVLEIPLNGTDDRKVSSHIPRLMDKKDIAAIAVGVFILISFMIIIVVEIGRNFSNNQHRKM